MFGHLTKGAAAVVIIVALALVSGATFIVQQTQYSLVFRFGQIARAPITEPGLYFKVPFVENIVTVDKRILDLDLPVQSVLSSDRQNLEVDAFLRYKVKDPLKFLQTVSTVVGANQRLSSFTNSAMRNVLANATFPAIIRTERALLMNRIQEEINHQAEAIGVEVVDLRLTRVDLPQSNSQAVYDRMRTERQQEAADLRANGNQQATTIRAKADRDVTVIVADASSTGETLRGQGDAERNAIFAEAFNRDPEFFTFYRSMQAYETSLKGSDTRMVISPKSDFFRYFGTPTGQKNGEKAAP
jgi:membrane protease subunit HflC